MALSAFDGQAINTSDQNLANEDLDARRRYLENGRNKFKLFLRDWTRGNTYNYREQLIKQATKLEPIIEVDLEDISAFDENLFQLILSNNLAASKAQGEKPWISLHLLFLDGNQGFKSIDINFLSHLK